VVKGREAAVVELQWRRLREMKMEKGGDGVQPFSRGEEARRLHSAGGGQHSKEQRGSWGGRKR
jgi:hypothetical protein